MTEGELLILGASSDFGMALIRRVHNNYSKIYAHCFNHTDALQRLACEVGTDKLKLYNADLENEEQLIKMLCDIEAEGGNPVHIVHFPSMGVVQERFHKIEWEQYERRFNIALRSLVLVLKKYLPKMAKRKEGKVVVMASSCTVNAPPRYMSAYVAEKYAMLGITKALAAEYADRGVQINAISPEMTNTKFLKEMPELIVEQNALNSPLKRNLNIDEVIPAIEFLLSDGADRITGQNIAVTGGM